MLRPQIAVFLRRDTPVLATALFNNLHTSQIVLGKSKGNRDCEPVPVAVILCGCGSLDGTEVTEAVSTAIHLRQKGMKPLFYAPDVELCGVVDHLTREMDSASSPRNALVEAARLARSSNFATKGADCVVLPDLEKLIEDFYCEKKPIGSICIASAVVAKVLNGVKVTLGKESPKEEWPHAEAIKKVRDMGAKIEMKDVRGVTYCKKHLVFSTPAWLYACATFSDIHEGIGKMIGMMKKCVKKPT